MNFANELIAAGQRHDQPYLAAGGILVNEITHNELRQIIREEIGKAISLKKQQDELLSREEASQLLGVKVNTMAVWAMKGLPPAPTKIGSCVRYKRSELERFINENTLPR